MNKMARGLSYLVGASFEAVALVIGAAIAGKWLDINHPQSFRWIAITMPFCLLVIAHTFYVVLRAVIRMEKSEEPKDGEGGDSDAV